MPLKYLKNYAIFERLLVPYFCTSFSHLIVILKKKRLIINFHWLEFCLKSFYELHMSFNVFM